MQTTSGSSSRASGLSTIELTGPLTAGRLLFLMGLGAVTILLHETFHYPLKLPGHHGLEGMALLVLGRLTCTSRWAATIVAMSAAATAAATGSGHDMPTAGLYLAPGIALDLLVMAWPAWRSQLWLVPILTAFAYATKPLLRWGIAELSGLHFGSLRDGVLFPFSTHLLYGFTGALVAVALWKITTVRLKHV